MRIALRDLEHIRDIYRQSKWVLLEPFFVFLAGLAVPWYLAARYGALQSLKGWLLLWSVLVVLYIMRRLIIWRGNCYIITNQRLIKFYKHGLLDRNVVETPIERILNISYKTTLPFPYGDVEVQVVGLLDPIVLKYVGHPDQIKDYIWELHNRISGSRGTFQSSDIEHVQERVGYAKRGKRDN